MRHARRNGDFLLTVARRRRRSDIVAEYNLITVKMCVCIIARYKIAIIALPLNFLILINSLIRSNYLLKIAFFVELNFLPLYIFH